MKRCSSFVTTLFLLPLTAAAAGGLDDYQPAQSADFKPTLSTASAPASDGSFRAYIQGYTDPELFQKNNTAFAARLKLLDQAPAGSTVKVLTFVFDNGEVNRRLATHLCMAAKRGVNVELVTDSKSGDRPGLADVFDNAHNKVNEESYQFMASCGVKVSIHNHLASFNTLFGHSIPKISKVDSAVTVLIQLRKIGTEFVDIVREEIESDAFRKEGREALRKAGLTREALEELKPHAYRLLVSAMIARREAQGRPERNFWEKALATMAKTPGLRDDQVVAVLEDSSKAPALFDESLAAIYESLSRISLTNIDPRDLNRLTAKLKERFHERPELVSFYEDIRRFNRLNHRKLFLVESPAGDACMFLGGRNLGDHYLAWHHDSFIDGDVLYCRHHEAAAKDVIDQAKESFDELKNSQYDYVLGKDNDSSMTHFKPVAGFQFRELIVPNWARNIFGLKGIGQALPENPKSVAEADRTLIEPMRWKDQAPLHGVALRGAKNWRVIRVNWQPKAENDPVRQALVNAIHRETKEVYIETAYAEFDDALRNAVEGALERGVNVRLITNGLFVSDGPSKLIRVFMGLWTRDMQVKYAARTVGKGKFSVQFASLEAGHMIHFKGAGFACQKEEGRDPYRTFLIGSHNFHPRSGYSDKEHALQWEMEARADCRRAHGLAALSTPDYPDMVDYRDQFYREAQSHFNGKLLVAYPTLKDELDHVLSLDDKKMPPERKRRARIIQRALYHSEGGLRGGRGTEFFLNFLRDSGMRDFMGIVL